MRWVAGLTVLVLGAGGCGSKATTAGLRYCSPDGAAWESVAGPEAGTVAAALSCPGSISDYCLHYALGCPPVNWADAVAEQNATGFPPMLYLCDRYNWVDDGWACDGNSVLFAYDKVTGKLLAAVQIRDIGSSGSQQICLAGPSTINPLVSCSAYFNCYLNDAGMRQGHCYGDGGVGGSGDGG